MCIVCMQNPQSPEEGVRSSATGVIDCWQPSCGCWELISSPLQEQLEPFTAEPSLQPPGSLSAVISETIIKHQRHKPEIPIE